MAHSPTQQTLLLITRYVCGIQGDDSWTEGYLISFDLLGPIAHLLGKNCNWDLAGRPDRITGDRLIVKQWWDALDLANEVQVLGKDKEMGQMFNDLKITSIVTLEILT